MVTSVKRTVYLALLIVCLGAAILNLLLPFAYFNGHGLISVFYYFRLGRQDGFDLDGIAAPMLMIFIFALLTAAALVIALVRVFRVLDREDLAPRAPKPVPVPGLKLNLFGRLSLGIGPILGLGFNAVLILAALIVLPYGGRFDEDVSVTAVPFIGLILLVCALRLCKALNNMLPAEDPAAPVIQAD